MQIAVIGLTVFRPKIEPGAHEHNTSTNVDTN